MRTSEVKVGEPIVVIFTIQNTTKKTLVFKKYGIPVSMSSKEKVQEFSILMGLKL